MIVVKITQAGVSRVLDGKAGMTFLVDKFTQRYGTTSPEQRIMHVRDYRYANGDGALARPFQIWSLSPGDYEIIAEGANVIVDDYYDRRDAARKAELMRGMIGEPSPTVDIIRHRSMSADLTDFGDGHGNPRLNNLPEDWA